MDDKEGGGEMGGASSGGGGGGGEVPTERSTPGGFVSAIRNTLTGSTAPPTKASLEAMGVASSTGAESSPVGGTLTRGSALFDAKFGSGTTPLSVVGWGDTSTEQMLEIK